MQKEPIHDYQLPLFSNKKKPRFPTLVFYSSASPGLGHVSCAEPIPPIKTLWVSVYSTFHGILSASNVSYLPRNSPHKCGCSHSLPSIPQSTGHETTPPPGSAAKQTSLFHLCSHYCTCFFYNDMF